MYPLLATYFIGEVPINSENYKRYDKPTEIHTPAHIEELTEIVKAKIEPLQASTLQEIEPVEQVAVPEPKPAQTSSTSVRGGAPAGYFQYGWCTYGAWSLAPWVGAWGDAKMWDDNARRDGHTVSRTPIAGSVFVDNSGYYGHVGVVLYTSGTNVVVKDMNFVGFGKWSTRTVPASSYVYIYP